MNKVYKIVYDHLIAPITHSEGSVNQVCVGVAVGLFVGLTPTMGIQMYISAALWGITKLLFRYNFNLPVSVAMVWISNPLTVIPIYYAFLITGIWGMNAMGYPHEPISREYFEESFATFTQMGFLDSIIEGTKWLLVDLGWPMLLGSLFYAIPISIVSFFVTKKFLSDYRARQTM